MQKNVGIWDEWNCERNIHPFAKMQQKSSKKLAFLGAFVGKAKMLLVGSDGNDEWPDWVGRAGRGALVGCPPGWLGWPSGWRVDAPRFLTSFRPASSSACQHFCLLVKKFG